MKNRLQVTKNITSIHNTGLSNVARFSSFYGQKLHINASFILLTNNTAIYKSVEGS